MWSVALAVAVMLVLDTDTSVGVMLFFVVFSFGSWFANRGAGIVWIPLGIVASSVIVHFFDLIIGPEHLTVTLAFVILILGNLAIMPLRERISSPRRFLSECDLPALATAVLLTVRWPQTKSIDYLGLLTFEDNAAWVGMGSELLRSDPEPSYTGPAVSLLRSAMSMVRLTHSGGRGSTLPGDSYVLVGLTYLFFIFLAATVAGSAIARLIPNASKAVRIVLSIGGSAFTYVMLDLPLSTGHLTFIGSLMFVWALFCLPQGLDATRGTVALPMTILLIGAASIWWPIAPAGVSLLILTAASRPRFRRIWRRWPIAVSSRMRPAFRLGVVLLATLAMTLVIVSAIRFLPMSFRDFMNAKGGLQPLPQNLLLLGSAGILTLFIWRMNDRVEEGWIAVIVVLATYALGLSLVAQFVGPDYAINYAPAKLLLFFGIVLAPFMFITPAYLLRNQSEHAWALLTAVALVVQGSFISNWSLNSPRLTPPPTWGTALLDAANHGNSIVVCLTSVEERRIDAYVCSRHAASLSEIDPDAAAAWRHLVLFPESESAAGQQRVDVIAAELKQQVRRRVEFVILSIDEEFRVADVDEWWFSQLPQPDTKLLVS